MDEEECGGMADLLDCTVGSFPLSYLGIPISKKRLTKEDWWPLINKVHRRLDYWKGRTLSRGGRLVLLNSVLTSLPLYFMSIYHMPEWVVKKIDKIRRAFLWKGEKEVNGITCLMKWERVCSPRLEGGLGVKNLRKFNEALLGKWLWSFLTTKERPWKSLVRFNYFNNRRVLLRYSKAQGHVSGFWRGVEGVFDKFKVHYKMQCHNGTATSFWHDRWINEMPLAEEFPNIYRFTSNPEGTVQDSMVALTPRFHLRSWLPNHIILEFIRARKSIEQFRWTSEEDEPSWIPSRKGTFTTKSFYECLQGRGVKDVAAERIWKTKCPLKVKVHVTLVLSNRLLTSERLRRTGIQGFSCALCGLAEDSASHLFLACSVFRDILRPMKNKLDIKHWPSSIRALWTTWRGRRVQKDKEQKWDQLVMAATWHVWMERNRRLFQRQQIPTEIIRHRVVECANSWGRFFSTQQKPLPLVPAKEIFARINIDMS